MLDLQRRNKVGKLGMVGVNGRKFPEIRAHMQRVLGDVFTGIEPNKISTWPADDVVDPNAYKEALKHFEPGDCAVIFTPDDTHFELATACLEAGLHVLVTKPPVKTLEAHKELAAKAAQCGRICSIEVHKRYDPIYADARDRILSLGPFSYFTAHMSQPKHQLETFKAWAGKSSDISYYLNSHHVDFHEWCLQGRARAERVTAYSSTGVAEQKLGRSCEDTITLAVTWRNRRQQPQAAGEKRARDEEREGKGSFSGGSLGHATYTSSWIAPKADVHSQQRWFYMGHGGEVSVDQAHRGYYMSTDAAGYASHNPLFWKPTRDAVSGGFAGQRCYGYISFETFVEAAAAVNAGQHAAKDFDRVLPAMASTAGATAILEAGRRSLDSNGHPIELVYADEFSHTPVQLKPFSFA